MAAPSRSPGFRPCARAFAAKKTSRIVDRGRDHSSGRQCAAMSRSHPLPRIPMKNCFLLSLLTTTLAAVLPAQDMPKPTAEHQKLAASVGSWDAVIEAMGEDGKPQTTKGVSEVRLGPGGFWVIDDFNGSFGGMPFVGHGVTGWDAAKGKYVGTWVDSMSGHMMLIDGTMSADGKTMTMTGMAPDMT